ncbi:MAG: hypothetical protein HQK77_15290 [Desulfobacterales bacterium]|nr:hypothetical protein [Desulfobacterales bacterium]
MKQSNKRFLCFSFGIIFLVLLWVIPSFASTHSEGGLIDDAADGTTAEGALVRVYYPNYTARIAESTVDFWHPIELKWTWVLDVGFILQWGANTEHVAVIEKEINPSSDLHTGYYAVTNKLTTTNDPDEFATCQLRKIPIPQVIISGNQNNISWSTATEDPGLPQQINIIGYQLYRSTQASGNFTKISSQMLTSTTYTDTDIVPGTKYYYAIKLVYKGGVEGTYLSATQVETQPTTPQSLIAHYPFDGNANDLISGNNGTVDGATPAADRFGNPNGAYQFDGMDDYISIPLTVLNQSKGSISFWFKTLKNTQRQIALFALENGGIISDTITEYTIAGFAIFLDQRGGAPQQNLFPIFTHYPPWALDVSETQFNSKTNFNWNHVVVVHDGISPKLYLNGVSLGTNPYNPTDVTLWWDHIFSSTPSANSAGFGKLLSRTDSATVPFNGLIDDARIYNYSLSEAEVKALYESLPTVLKGSLTVNLTPQGSIDAGAQWRLNNDSSWRNNGDTVSSLSAGTYTVEFKDVTGWNKPENKTITLENGQNTTATGTYTQITPSSHTITANAGPGGEISPSGLISIAHGGALTFTFSPAADYEIEKFLVDGIPEKLTSCFGFWCYTLNNVTADHTIEVTFIPSIKKYTITATAGSGGSISPSGSVTVEHGKNQTFNISSNTSYTVEYIKIDGVSVEPADSYTFSNVTANHSIAVTFKSNVIVKPLSISPTELSISEVSSVHSFTISGGKTPYTAITKNGSATVNQSTVTYTAPNITTDDVLTVYDASGKSVTASIAFSVGNVIIVAVSEKTVSRGEVVELEATGGMSELIWTAPVGGSFIPSDGYKGPSVQFKAPDELGDYTVTVSDNLNNSRNIVIHVRNKPVLSPKYNWINADYKDVTLQVIGGNPPYHWTVDQGSIVPKTDTATAVYSSPRIIDGEATITVTDHSGLQDTATVFINRPMRLRQEFVVSPGKRVDMIVSGGYPPFIWNAMTGEFRDKDGNIVSEGEIVVYHASDLLQDDTITVTDASGNTCQATVYNRTPLSFVTASKSVQLGSAVTMQVQGGVPPYQWSIDDSAEILSYSGQDNTTADIQVASIAGPTLSSKKNMITITVTDKVAGHQIQGFLFVMGELRVNPSQQITLHRGESVKLEVFNGAGNYIAVSERGYVQSVTQSYNLGIFKYSTVNPETISTEKPAAIPVGQDTITVYDGANTKLTINVDVITELEPVITPSMYSGEPGMEITMMAVHGLPPYRWDFWGANGDITPLNEDASIVHVVVSNVTETAGRVVVTDQFDKQGYAEVITTRPLRITPRAATIFPGQEQTFSALGGLGNYEWELLPMPGVAPIPGAQLSSVTGKNTTFTLPPEVDSGSMLIQLSDSSSEVVTATISISPMTLKAVDEGNSASVLLTFSPNEINTGLIFIRILTPKKRSFFMTLDGMDNLTQELVAFFDLKGQALREFQIVPFFGGFLPAIQKEKLKALDGKGVYRLDIIIYDPDYKGNKTEYLEWDGQFIPVIGMVQGSTSILVED